VKNKNLPLLIIILVALRLGTLAIPPLTDPSEARYAELAKVMAHTGEWFAPQVWIDGELIPFKGKPPLGFWLMAGSMKAFGYNEFAARLPSALCSMLLLFLMFLALNRYSDDYTAWTAVAVTATSASFFILSGAVLVDSVLSLFSMGAVFFYYAFLKEELTKTKKLLSIMVFVFLALAFITKGPVGLVYFGIPVFFWTLLSGQWSTLKNHSWIVGGALFLLITIPCFLLMENAMPGFLNYFFVRENFLRYTTKNYGDLYSSAKHGLPLGVAIPLTLVACLPWILLSAQILISRFWRSNDGKKTDESDNSEVMRSTPSGDKIVSKKELLVSSLQHLRSYAQAPETLFSIGLVSLVIFWSCSSHLMFYYLIVMVPLFGAWLAAWMRTVNFPLRKTAWASIVLIAFYSATSLPVSMILESDKSTRGILREVEKLPGVDKTAPIVFVRRVPYSAYFYAGNRVLPHAEERVSESALKALSEKNAVLVSLKKYLKRMPGELRGKFIVKIEKGKWTAAVIRKPEERK